MNHETLKEGGEEYKEPDNPPLSEVAPNKPERSSARLLRLLNTLLENGTWHVSAPGEKEEEDLAAKILPLLSKEAAPPAPAAWESMELPPDAYMEQAIADSFFRVRDAIRSSGIADATFEEHERMYGKVVTSFLPDAPHAQFIPKDIVKMLGLGNNARLHVGGTVVRFRMAEIQESLAQSETSVEAETLLRLALDRIVAHEYGHAIEAFYDSPSGLKNNPLVANAQRLSGNPIDAEDGAAIVSERFAESIADIAMQNLLRQQPHLLAPVVRSMSPDTSVARAFTAFAETGKRLGLRTRDMERALDHLVNDSKATSPHLAEQLKHLAWRNAGYDLPRYDVEQLTFMLAGIRRPEPENNLE